MPQGAFNVHGLSDDFLKDKPLFIDIADDFLNFIQDSPLVIHNAAFDMKFLNAELRWAKKAQIQANEIIDTLLIARKKFPGSPATLDALCKRFNISLDNRTKHGALIDTQLLAEVYLNLCEGRAPSLGFNQESAKSETNIDINNIIGQVQKTALPRQKPLEYCITDDEENAHKAFVEKFKQKSLWLSD
jgi:DNA polymerase-3 subunit epsilon